MDSLSHQHNSHEINHIFRKKSHIYQLFALLQRLRNISFLYPKDKILHEKILGLTIITIKNTHVLASQNLLYAAQTLETTKNPTMIDIVE